MTTLTAERRALLLKRLADAEDAVHNVAIGGSVRTFVDQNGERIEYGPTNMTSLNKYIYGLKVELGLNGTGGPLETWLG